MAVGTLYAQTASQPPQRVTAPSIKQAAVDFIHPPRAYVKHRSRGWQVFVEKQLEKEDPGLSKSAQKRLDSVLGDLIQVLPASSLPDLRKLNIFLMYGTRATSGGRASGLEYYRAGADQYQPWIDPRMAHSIVIYSADNFVKLSDLWARKALIHELGHAQHLEHWPEDRADIYDTWDHAMKAGMYKTVQEIDKTADFPNYAAQNHLEYFAELTAMYFVNCNYFPHNRTELKRYDPEGYALIEKIWLVNAKQDHEQGDSQTTTSPVITPQNPME